MSIILIIIIKMEEARMLLNNILLNKPQVEINLKITMKLIFTILIKWQIQLCPIIQKMLTRGKYQFKISLSILMMKSLSNLNIHRQLFKTNISNLSINHQ